MTFTRYLRDRLTGAETRVELSGPVQGARDDPRLARHVWHDPRSRRYDARRIVGRSIMPQSPVRHARFGPVFDQGELGSCTANAALGMMMSGRFWSGATTADARRLAADAVREGNGALPSLHGILGATAFTEADAVQLYREETRVDDSVIPGHYEPSDTGSTGLWSMKALANRGYLPRGYVHCFRWVDVVRLLAIQPVSVGIGWYEQMFSPDAQGYVVPAGPEAGGHQIVADQLIPVRDTAGRGQVVDYDLGFTNSWGTSFGQAGRFYLRGPHARMLLAQGGDVSSGRLPAEGQRT